MIKSFGAKATSDLFHSIALPGTIVSSSKVQRLRTQIRESTIFKLDILNAAISLNDLRSPPGSRCEVLCGDYAGLHSILANAQWSRWIGIFRRQDSSAYDIAIVDYHS